MDGERLAIAADSGRGPQNARRLIIVSSGSSAISGENLPERADVSQNSAADRSHRS
jgi:hypothetical protein